MYFGLYGNRSKSYFFLDIDQLTRILALCGTPTQETMEKISSVEAKNYINSLPKMDKKDFRSVFEGANPVAIDLLEKMLEIDPDRRITAEQTLAHPYLAQYADPTDEPNSAPYDQTFEDYDLQVQEWKGNQWQLEMGKFYFPTNFFFH